MTEAFLNQNPQPTRFQMQDLLRLFKKEVMLGLNCHHVGQIQSFDPTNQTAQATIVYKKAFFLPDDSGNYVAQQVDYPVLIDAPVICLGGGNGAITFPIQSGDECLILFNDRNIDKWFSGGTNGELGSSRLHSFTDGIILVGLRSLPHKLLSYDEDAVAIRFKTATGINKILVKEDKVSVLVGPEGAQTKLDLTATGQFKVSNAGGDFTQLLFQLLTDVLAFTAGGFPLTPTPDYAANLALLGAFIEP
jgi:hypothetical protein